MVLTSSFLCGSHSRMCLVHQCFLYALLNMAFEQPRIVWHGCSCLKPAMRNEPSEIILAEGPCPTHLIHSSYISHRLCVPQKRVVNVYRLITRGTLEEKIMGLQKFKMSIANTVISQDNASMQSMGTDQLLNLFTLDKVRLRDGKKRSVWLNFVHKKKKKICMESDLTLAIKIIKLPRNLPIQN